MDIFQTIIDKRLSILIQNSPEPTISTNPHAGPIRLLVFRAPLQMGHTVIECSGATVAEALEDLNTIKDFSAFNPLGQVLTAE